MKSNPAILIKNLSKQYRINEIGGLGPTIKALGQKLLDRKVMTHDSIWALRNINLSIEAGDIVGLIGANGAGKTTLLKILSRITPPTHGEAFLYGRVSSLLEVGTGFHPDLTGRENIFFNGTVLGMTRSQIMQAFDAIVTFAGVEQFIDTPVKHYSSGMRLRLAFAVAAHLEPEILLIDEILAVGDIKFRQQSLNRMKAFSKKGHTVIFVSHDLSSVAQLCSSAVCLDQGKIIAIGKTEDVIGQYLRRQSSASTAEVKIEEDDSYPQQVLRVAIVDANSKVVVQSISAQNTFAIAGTIVTREPHKDLYGVLILRDEFGHIVFFSDSRDNQHSLTFEKEGYHHFQLNIQAPLLAPGYYYLTLNISKAPRGTVHGLDNALAIEIVDQQSLRPKRPGHILLGNAWIKQ